MPPQGKQTKKLKMPALFKCPTVSSSFLFPTVLQGIVACKWSASFDTLRKLNLEALLTAQLNENHLMSVKQVYSGGERKANNNLFCLLAKRSVCVHSQIDTRIRQQHASQ